MALDDIEQLQAFAQELDSGLTHDFDELDRIEREHRKATSRALSRRLRELNPDNQVGLIFHTYGEDVRNRDALLITHPERSNKPAAYRLIVSDEVIAPDFSRQMLVGKEYVYRPLGHLLTKKVCEIERNTEGGWRIDEDSFMVRKDLDNPITKIYHGPEYHREFPVDVPWAKPEELYTRRIIAEEFLRLATSLPAYDSLPTNYLFVRHA